MLLPLIKVRSRISEMIKDSGHSQTVKVVMRENICTHSKRTKLLVIICKDKNMQKKILTNASFWRDVSWWTSLTLREPEIPVLNDVTGITVLRGVT